MCSETALRFVLSTLTESDVRDAAVIEVGSYNVNGSARDGVVKLGPVSTRYAGLSASSTSTSPAASTWSSPPR
jgi:hypothetical protein